MVIILTAIIYHEYFSLYILKRNCFFFFFVVLGYLFIIYLFLIYHAYLVWLKIFPE